MKMSVCGSAMAGAGLLLAACAGGGGGAEDTTVTTPTATVPAAPGLLSVSAQDGAASVSFSAPASDGGSTILSYIATCQAGNNAVSASGTSSPLLVGNLVNGTAYLCSVLAQNAVGSSAASAGISVTPTAALTAIDPTKVPLGDGKVTTTTPAVGYVYVCTIPSSPNPGGREVPWISADGKTWDSTAKVAVQGDVAWDSHYFSATRDGSDLRVDGNGLPEHHTGSFPIARTDPAYQYDPNPNGISAQTLAWRLPADPVVASAPNCTQMGAIGILKSGSYLFNALDADALDAVVHEVQDSCEGHPQSAGKYHYHNVSKCHGSSDTVGQHSPLAGWAADGFGIYGNLGEGGKALTNADLDICHGHSHEIDWNGASKSMYHYHATLEYPYSVGCFRGTPVRID